MRGLSRRHGLRPGLHRDLQDQMVAIFIVSLTQEGRRDCVGGLIVGTDTPEQQQRFAENPKLFLKYSKMIESELNQRFKFILNGTPEAEGAREVSTPQSVPNPRNGGY